MFNKKNNNVKEKANKKSLPEFDPASFFQASTIFDDFGTLMDNMDSLKEIDFEELTSSDHIQAIKFYSFLKFRRYIVKEIKDEIKQQMTEFKSEIHQEIRHMFKSEKASFL